MYASIFPDDLRTRTISDNYNDSQDNNFCSRYEPVRTSPCVEYCSCESYCGLNKICCPDHTEVEGEPHSSCIYPLVFNSLLLLNSDRIKAHKEIHPPLIMGDDCLREYHGTELQKQCFLYRNTANMDNLVPVMSKETGVLYVNRFCAECNEVSDYVIFRVDLICYVLGLLQQLNQPSMMKNIFENRNELIASGKCFYHFEIPDNRSVEEYRCMTPHHNSCNETRKWDTYDSHLENTCSSYKLPYWDRLSKTVYRNIHCFMCNSRSSEITFINDYNISEECIRNANAVLKESFFSIIDMERVNREEVDEEPGLSSGREKSCNEKSFAVFDSNIVSFTFYHITSLLFSE